MEVLDHYFYTKEHEWVHIEDNEGTVGITEFAQSALGDITFVELPSVGAEFEQFEQFASIESVKAASDIYLPLAGKIIDVNDELESDPELINRHCYEKGWLVKIEITSPDDVARLMNAEEYRNYLESIE